jgi:hypothetical protein
MTVVLSLILFIHAIIHAIGFSKAFGLQEFQFVSKPISHSQGIAWAICALLFIAAASGNMMNKKWWPLAALLAVIVSEILLIKHWKSAGWGTVINLIIFVIAVVQYSDFRFTNQSGIAAKQLLAKAPIHQNGKTDTALFKNLPPVVQNWLHHSGIAGKHPLLNARLKQEGKMKTDPRSGWMLFTASQYIITTEPGYLWQTKLQWKPFLFLSGRDELREGHGSMQMNMLSLWPVTTISNNEAVNSGSLIRYLAEICWIPSAALNPMIKWQAVDEHHAQAIITADDTKASGIFSFNSKGDITGFTARRYKIDGNISSLETWQVNMLGYKTFQGIRIPYRCSVTWKLAEGDFTWLQMEITDIEYNVTDQYKQ